MNAADQAIAEIRAVRHRISAEYGHDIRRHLAALQEMEKQHPEQLKRGMEIVARRKAERKKYPAPADDALALRDRPISDEAR